MQDLPFTLPKYVDNLPPTTFESNARTLKVNQIKDFENVVKESVYFSQKHNRISFDKTVILYDSYKVRSRSSIGRVLFEIQPKKQLSA